MYGLCFTGENKQERETQVIVIQKNITHSILLFLTSRAYYTPNATSSFQLYRINLGDVQTNHGPTNNKKLPNYPSKECGKNVPFNQDALLCAACTTWTHTTCLSYKRNLKALQSTTALRTPRYYGHPAIMDSSKIPGESYRRLTEINSRYYGLSLLQTYGHFIRSQRHNFIVFSLVKADTEQHLGMFAHISSLFFLLFETVFVFFGRFPLRVVRVKYLKHVTKMHTVCKIFCVIATDTSGTCQVYTWSFAASEC